MKLELDKTYWEDRYKNGETQWDISQISSPIAAYFDQLDDKKIPVMIPGAGNSHEAAYLLKKGFGNITILDIAEKPLEDFKKRNPDFPHHNVICCDFFKHEAKYDLIVEQTFFCALSPTLRKAYAQKMSELLVTGGKLVGLLFDFELTEKGPPFGGDREEYISYFRNDFKIQVMEQCYNSIKPRAGRELFIILEKL